MRTRTKHVGDAQESYIEPAKDMRRGKQLCVSYRQPVFLTDILGLPFVSLVLILL